MPDTSFPLREETPWTPAPQDLRLLNAVAANNLPEAREALEAGAQPNAPIFLYRQNHIPPRHRDWERAVHEESLLSRAVRHRQADMAALLLAHGADANLGAPLYWAAWNADTALATLLLNHGADPQTCFEGWTPIHDHLLHGRQDEYSLELHMKPFPAELAAALRACDLEAVQALMFRHKVTSCTCDGHCADMAMSPLAIAAMRGHTDMVCLLLEQGAGRKKEPLPLYEAAWSGKVELVQLLLERGADAAKSGALDAAAWRGHLPVARLLLEQGAEPDGERGYTLSQAAAHGQLDMVKLLLTQAMRDDAARQKRPHKADDSAMRSFIIEHRREHALRDAAQYGHMPVVRYLLAQGAGVQNYGALTGAAGNGHAEIAALLLDHGANPNETDRLGQPVLLSAVKSGNAELVRLLLERGAHFKPENGFSGKLLLEATLSGHEEVVRLLLERGAQPNHARGDYGHSPLFYAARDGLLNIAHLLLDFNADADIRDNFGNTPLCVALHTGQYEAATLLLERGANINALSYKGRTALQDALHSNNEGSINFLLARRADINARNALGSTLLHEAAVENKPELARNLLQRGAAADARDAKGRTALHISAAHGYGDLAQELLAHGADVAATDSAGKTALHLAEEGGHRELARLLRQQGAPLPTGLRERVKLNAALRRAVQQGNSAHARQLLELGADANLRPQGEAPLLHQALTAGRRELAELLLARGADINAWDGSEVRYRSGRARDIVQEDDGAPLLHSAARKGQAELARYLLRHGADIEAVDANGDTALYHAVKEGHRDIVDILLEAGASLRNESGDEALQWATWKDWQELVELLLDHGGDVNAKGAYGGSLLHVAAGKGYLPLATMLLERGADVHLTDRWWHSTALHIAASRGQLSIAKLLLRHGADPDLQDDMGRTPQDCAKWQGHVDISLHFIHPR